VSCEVSVRTECEVPVRIRGSGFSSSAGRCGGIDLGRLCFFIVESDDVRVVVFVGFVVRYL